MDTPGNDGKHRGGKDQGNPQGMRQGDALVGTEHPQDHGKDKPAQQVIEDRLAQRGLSGTVAARVLADSKGVQVIFDCGGDAAAAATVKDMMAPFALRWRIADHASAPQVGA